VSFRAISRPGNIVKPGCSRTRSSLCGLLIASSRVCVRTTAQLGIRAFSVVVTCEPSCGTKPRRRGVNDKKIQDYVPTDVLDAAPRHARWCMSPCSRLVGVEPLAMMLSDDSDRLIGIRRTAWDRHILSTRQRWVDREHRTAGPLEQARPHAAHEDQRCVL